MKIAALQMCSSMDWSENISTIEEACHQAQQIGVRYLQVPEMAVMFAEHPDQLKAFVKSKEHGEALERLARAARENELYLHVGSMAVAAPNNKCFNRAFLFSPAGEIVATYDKIHLFDADVAGDRPYRESDNFAPGEKAVLADMDSFKLGMAICYDVRFPSLFATLRQAGAQIITVPAAFTVPTGEAHWESLLRARAIETGCYLVAAAQSGAHQNGRKTYGHSMIISPWGDILASCDQGEGLLITASLDAQAIKDARFRIPTLANAREFSLSVNHNAAQ